MKIHSILISAAIISIFAGTLTAQKLPRVFIADAKEYRDLRDAAAKGGAMSDAAKCAYTQAKRDADKSLNVEIQPVTAKEMMPPSGDKHDYMSLAPYFWPDPKKKDGLPYIRRDGERNPELKNYPDDDNFAALIKNVDRLGRGYYITGDEKYAAKGIALLRMWFIDPATRMNPNMNFAQAVKGESTGRNFGIIETWGLTKVVDAVGLFAESKQWAKADQDGMVKWFEGYIDWLQNSKLGKLEAATKNNHGTHYDEQLADFALFVGKNDLAKSVIETAKTKRIAAQIEPDGQMPLELARTQSWNYSTMNLSGFVDLAILGRHVDVDLWNYTTKDGRSIRKAFDYLSQYTAGGKKWEHQVLSPLDPEKFNRLVRLAAAEWKDKPFAELAAKSKPADDEVCSGVFDR